MKQKVLLLIFTLLSTLTASAYDAEINGIYYNLDNVSKQATVTSGDTKYTGNVEIPETVTYNNVTYDVSSIGEKAFYWLHGLTSVTIPNSVISIGNRAFYDCINMTSVTIGNSVTSIGERAFTCCSSLTSVTIPNSVTSIGEYAFNECKKLSSVTIGDNVTSIENGTFAACTGLSSVTIGKSVKSIGNYAFYICRSLTSITIPNGITTIGNYAFQYCEGLASITIPESITRIGYFAFKECTGLNSVTINCSNVGGSWFSGLTSIKEIKLGEGVTTINNGAFAKCTGLTSVTIPNGVTSIDNYAFEYCTGLTDVKIGSSVASIKNSAFYGCSGLTAISVVDGNMKFDSRDNCNAIIETETNTLVVGCMGTVIPSNVTAIGKEAFHGCSGLTSVTIPNGVKIIEYNAFGDCTGLTSVTIPSSVTSIEYSAFSRCSGLSSIIVDEENTVYDSRDNCNGIVETSTNSLLFGCKNTIIPESVTSIGMSAFYGCTTLTNIKIPKSVSSIGWYAFQGCTNLTDINIPENVNTVGNKAFENTAWINSQSDGVLILDGWVVDYKGEKPVGDLIIPAGIKGIADATFYDCSDLVSVHLPESITRISESVFSNCSSLTTINIPEYVVSIGYQSFASCALTSITIPNSVTSLGSYAFAGCKSLTSVVISNSIKELNDNIFYNCTNLESIKIPASLEKFNMYAFEKCPNISSISVDENNPFFDSRDNCNAIINSSTNKLLYGCKNTVIPTTVSSIAAKAFMGSNITNIDIPNNIESIGNSAFADCNELKSVTVRLANPIQIETNVFSDIAYNKAVLYVPNGRKIYFEDATAWGKFCNIQEIDMPDVDISDSPFANVGNNQMILGYYKTDDYTTDNGFGGSVAGRYRACIGFDKAKNKPFAGNKITYVRFALVKTDISDVKVWISSARDAAPLYIQNVPSITTGWNEVKLDKAFEIPEDSIFIGIEYDQQQATYPLSYVEEGYEEGSFYLYGPYANNSDNIWLDGELDSDYSMSLQCLIEGDKIPMYDLHTTRLSFSKKYVQAGNSYYSYLYLRNWGKKNISSATIACEIDGTEIITRKVSSVSHNIQGEYLYFKIGEITPGKHRLTLRVKDINGNAPEFPSDDAQSVYIKSYSQDMGRDKVMLELYTATWCPNTPRAHKSIAALMEERDDIVLVSNHLSDIMSCDASEAYGAFTQYTPTTYYDRYAGYGATSLGYNGIDDAKAQPSLAKLYITAEYDDNNRQLTIKVNGVKNEEFDAIEEYANLTVLLTEDGIIYPQNDREEGKYINGYVHNGVLRTNVSEIWGDPVTWTGDKFKKTYTITLDDKWVKDNMHVVAFLAKPFTGSNYEEIGLVNCNEFLVKNAMPKGSEIDPRGDVNGDGVVNGTDIQAVINAIVEGEYDERADVNEDDKVNGTDIQEVINIIVNAE